MAEVSVFPKPEVRKARSLYVEARLHSDAHDLEKRERIAELIETVAKTEAQPTYVVVDTKTEAEVSRYNGAPILAGDDAVFVEFLESSR